MPNIIRYQASLPVNKQYGERLRLRVVTGANQNNGYSLMGERVLVGRGDDCDIQLNDVNMSKHHFEFRWEGNHYSIYDLQSANGVLVNERKVSSSPIKIGDLITVGLTIFEVMEAGSVRSRRVLPQGGAMQKYVEAHQRNNPQDKERLKKRAIILIFGLVVIGYLVFVSDDDVKTFRERARIFSDDLPKHAKKEEIKEAMQNDILNKAPDTPQYIEAEKVFRRGLRELQNHNYKRAITDFETALTIDQTHDQAKIYIKIAKNELEKEVTAAYKAAERARKSYRYKEARMHYNSILQYLEDDPNNQKYIDAKQSIEALDKLEGRLP